MSKNHIIDLLPSYLDDLLDENQKKAVEAHLGSCGSCSQELAQLKALFSAFDDEETSVPSDMVRTRFLEQLEQEKNQSQKAVHIDSGTKKGSNTWGMDLLKVAAGIALLISAFLMGKYQQEKKSGKEIAFLANESMEMKQMAMLSLMENKSASKRIQGVGYVGEFSEPDDAIVKALADRMLYDENINVRRTAVEVLEGFTASATAKNSFIKALKIEKDPGIQIAIIQILGQLREKKAIAPMKYLLEQDDTQPYVKKQLETVLPQII